VAILPVRPIMYLPGQLLTTAPHDCKKWIASF
jgi:hypothetical protein